MSGGNGQMTDKWSMLTGLGIRPDWVRQNPEKAAVIGAAAAAPFTGGASLAAVGPGAAAGGAAAGAGAAGAAAATEAALASSAAAGGGLLGAGAAATPELLGAAGSSALAAAAPEVGTAAGVGASGGIGTQMSTAALQSLGNMGPEQAAALAAQNEGFGAAGLNSTLQAANPQYAQASNMFDKGADALKLYNKAQGAMNQAQPQQPQQRTVSKPPGMGQQAQPLTQSTFAQGTPGPFSAGMQGAPMGGLLGGGKQNDSARQLILKRLGLLGGM
jgi:hypothetical protein